LVWVEDKDEILLSISDSGKSAGAAVSSFHNTQHDWDKQKSKNPPNQGKLNGQPQQTAQTTT
jgi:hypothetical protein